MRSFQVSGAQVPGVRFQSCGAQVPGAQAQGSMCRVSSGAKSNFHIKNILRLKDTGKTYPKIKIKQLRKVRVWTVG